MNKHIETIPAATMQKLVSWPWPGNVRELQNMVEPWAILSRVDVLDIPLTELTQCSIPAFDDNSDAATIEAIERDHILRVLRDTSWVIGGQCKCFYRC